MRKYQTPKQMRMRKGSYKESLIIIKTKRDGENRTEKQKNWQRKAKKQKQCYKYRGEISPNAELTTPKNQNKKGKKEKENKKKCIDISKLVQIITNEVSKRMLRHPMG